MSPYHVQPSRRCWDSRYVEGGFKFSDESKDILYSALATLPALESIKIFKRELRARTGDVAILANTESPTELLRVPALRSVNFYRFSVTPALFRATANAALLEGTAITNLEFMLLAKKIKEASHSYMLRVPSKDYSKGQYLR
jgi:hypothetical protein